MKYDSKPLLITPGEPAGIGPDIVILTLQKKPTSNILVLADPELLKDRATSLGVEIRINDYNESGRIVADKLNLIPVSLKSKCQPGIPDPENAAYVLDCLSQAVDLCLKEGFSGIVTGPVQKSTINEAGISFSGHTEWFARQTGVHRVVMMLVTQGLRVALATTHLPLREVADQVTEPLLTDTITILHTELQTRFRIKQPHILVCGLNPHAGEQGYLGTEEIEIIEPTLKQLRSQGLNLTGPLPADTLFTPKYLQTADAVLAMYHDQGLPVLKHMGFGSAANITLGLPLIRTSVDHGTALDLAATGNIDCGSMEYAIQAAAQMALCASS